MMVLHDVCNHQRRRPRQPTLAMYQDFLPLRCSCVNNAGQGQQVHRDVGVVFPPAVVILYGGNLRLQVSCLLSNVNNYIKWQKLLHRGFRIEVDTLWKNKQWAFRVDFAHVQARARYGLAVFVQATFLCTSAIRGQHGQTGLLSTPEQVV